MMPRFLEAKANDAEIRAEGCTDLRCGKHVSSGIEVRAPTFDIQSACTFMKNSVWSWLQMRPVGSPTNNFWNRSINNAELNDIEGGHRSRLRKKSWPTALERQQSAHFRYNWFGDSHYLIMSFVLSRCGNRTAYIVQPDRSETPYVWLFGIKKRDF